MTTDAITTIRNLELLAVFVMAWGLAIAFRPRGGNGLLRSIWVFFTINALFYTYAVISTVMGIPLVPAPYGGLVLVTGLLIAYAYLTWYALVRGVKVP